MIHLKKFTVPHDGVKSPHRFFHINQNRWLVALMISLGSLTVSAQTSVQAQQEGLNVRIDVLGASFSAAPYIAAQQSRIVVYRPPSNTRLAGATGVFVQGQYHTTLLPGGYSILCLPPGAIEVGARQVRVGNVAKDLYDSITALELASAQTAYLVVHEDAGRPVLKPVPSAQALQDLAQTRLQMHTVSRVTRAQPCMAGEAPAAPPVQYALAADALFAFGRSDLAGMNASGRAALDVLNQRIRQEFKQIDRVHVVGHTDPMGTVSGNERLSFERAQTVRQYLQMAGQISAPITFEGRGANELIVTRCATAQSSSAIACNQPNRRVVAEVTGLRH